MTNGGLWGKAVAGFRQVKALQSGNGQSPQLTPFLDSSALSSRYPSPVLGIISRVDLSRSTAGTINENLRVLSGNFQLTLVEL